MLSPCEGEREAWKTFLMWQKMGGIPGRIYHLFRASSMHHLHTIPPTPKSISSPPSRLSFPNGNAQTDQYLPTISALFTRFFFVFQGDGVVTVIPYLWAIYFMLEHTWEHPSPDGLHNKGAIVHLLPARGDVDTELLTNSISPLHFKGSPFTTLLPLCSISQDVL